MGKLTVGGFKHVTLNFLEDVLQTELDVKKPEGSSAVVLENLPDDFNQDVLTLLVENIGNLSENDFSMELIPELRKAVVTFKNPSGKLFYSYKNIFTFVI